MRLILLEDAATALDTIQQKIEKGKQLIDKDFDEITDPDTIAVLLDPKSSKVNPVGANEKVVKKQYLMKLFGNKFSDIIETYSLIDQSLDTLGVDINNNLFLYYIKQLAEQGIETRKNFAALILNFLKSKKLSKNDIDNWLTKSSLYESDPKDTQYKIETILFLNKQNGAKEYNLRVDDGTGKYRYLKDTDLYDGSNFKKASEIKTILQQAQQTGEQEKDNKEQTAEADTKLTKAQNRIIKNVTSQVMQENPKANLFDLTNIVKTLIVDDDTEDSLLKKVTAYLEKRGATSTEEVKKFKPTDKLTTRLYNALVAAGYDSTNVANILQTNLFDSKGTFAQQIGQLATLLDSNIFR